MANGKTVEQFSAKVFHELHREIFKHEEEARTGTVDGVHDMRVAIRRLRVALSNFAFCLGKEDRRRIKARLEHLANALGGVRDLDVMIEALGETLASQSEEERSALQAFIQRLKSRRRGRLRILTAYLKGEEYAALKQEFAGGVKEAARSHGQAA